jgi:ADP-heptose:LPS heptosyltransferase
VVQNSKAFSPGESAGLESLDGNQREAQTAPSSRRPRILIIRAGAIGDTLMATPLVRAVRRTYPDAHLVFLCSLTAQDVLKYNPHLDQVIPLAFRHAPAWLSLEKSRLLRRLRQLNLEWVLALESHPSFLELARRAGAQHVIAYGALPGVDQFQRAAFDHGKHSIENHLRAAEPLGVRPSGFEMELYYPPALDDSIQECLSRRGVRKGERLVGIHAAWGGRKHSPEHPRWRTWPLERFAQIARWLVEDAKAQVVLTGAPDDHALTEFVEQRAGVPCLNLAGELSLLELAALIRRLDLYVTVDSGPAHMAAALGTPLVTLWGPAILEQTRPVAGQGPVHILYKRVHCAPCYGTPRMKSCQDNICMKQIEVAEVEEAIHQCLGFGIARQP